METIEVDVAIIGGAFTGASVGLLLKRKMPGANILIVERSFEPDRKVGESTSEVAGCFISKVLGLYTYLAQNHLPKYGLRLWFTGEGNADFERCGEIGPFYQTRLPTFQVDRSTLDPHILEKAVEAGCQVWRPARVQKLELGGMGNNLLEVKIGDEVKTVRAKWVVDASGKAAFIARQRKTLRQLECHPTNSLWARLQGVKDWDGYELREKFPSYAKACPCARGVATNHLTGRGWWVWIIPLKGGDVSVGVTWDERLYTLPEGANLTERLLNHLRSNTVGAEIFADARAIEKDTRMYSHLPYYTEEPAGDGWIVVGDAAGFMDPLYSQGLDYCGHTAMFTTKILSGSLMGSCVAEEIAEYKRQFGTSYFRWYEALYRDKYYYLGDMELMWAAFLLDLATYFIGPVRLVYDHPETEWPRLPYYGKGGTIFGKFMAFYNRRLVKIGQKRWEAGCYGRKNLDNRMFIKVGFSPDKNAGKVLWMGIKAWIKCEIHALFLRPKKRRTVVNAPQAASAPIEMLTQKPESV